MLLEVIVTGPDEASVAAMAGADRVELVAARERGGLTPDAATVRSVIEKSDVPVHVMARPHDRGFVYRGHDRAALLRDVALMASLTPAAIVVGAIDEHRCIDVPLLHEIINAARGVPITFHRAFDELADLSDGYRALAEFPQVARVLTSGGASDAWSGRETIAALVGIRSGPIILLGAGIDQANARALMQATGAAEMHVGNGARREGRLDPERIAALKKAME